VQAGVTTTALGRSELIVLAAFLHVSITYLAVNAALAVRLGLDLASEVQDLVRAASE
jgi:hypothetical protein